MSKSKWTDRVCGIGAALMVLFTMLYLCFGGTALTAAAAELPYVEKLFSTDKVHQIDIVADQSDWDSMLQNAAEEEYISCTAVIDGEKCANVGIRPKGNSSLTSVASSDSDRYSFKLEFDHYDKNNTYHGLDKLCLNNAIQDNTYMKDFLCYQMMNALGADAPLASFVWITVNGQDWGLYTAVEGIEDSFAQRQYGADHGQIYKPDSMDMGGGGRGAEARNKTVENSGETLPEPPENQPGGFDGAPPQEPDGTDPLGGPPQGEASQENGTFGQQENRTFGGFGNGNGNGNGLNGMGNRGSMGGSSDVLLRYSDDDPDSYPNIFDNAVFDTVTDADRARLIQSIKAMNEGDVGSSVNVDEVLRYFAVHNFVLNGDSYTGSIIHNYYLYEDEGLLSMIAWDYNLAFGGMGMSGAGSEGAASAVNSPIDSPISSGDVSERPMVAWIFDSQEYTEQYHAVMDQFLTEYFESGYFEETIDQITAMISPYVEKDPTAFCTYAEFQKGAETLKQFCLLRAESVRKQLNGDIPSTAEGQAQDSSSFVNASGVTLSDMGSQGGGMGKGFGQNENQGDTAAPGQSDDNQGEAAQNTEGEPAAPQAENGGENGAGFPNGRNFPGDRGNMPPGEGTAENPWETWLLLGGSCVLLAAGLLFARFYR